MSLETTRRDLDHTNGNLQGLRAAHQKSDKFAATLGERQKMMHTSMESLGDDLGGVRTRTGKLEETSEKRLIPDIEGLRNGLQNTNLQVNSVKAQADATRNALQEERTSLRDTIRDVGGLREDVEKAKTNFDLMEQKLASTDGQVKGAKTKLQDLKDTVDRMGDEVTWVKSHGNESADGLRKAVAALKMLQNGLNDTMKALEITQEKLTNTESTLGHARSDLDDVRHKAKAIGQGQTASMQDISALRSALSEVGATTMAVKAGLKEASSLLLPNVHEAHHEVRHATSYHGDLLSPRNR